MLGSTYVVEIVKDDKSSYTPCEWRSGDILLSKGSMQLVGDADRVTVYKIHQIIKDRRNVAARGGGALGGDGI